MDVVLLEVGIGVATEATNVVTGDPVITGWPDHQENTGRTIAEIAHKRQDLKKARKLRVPVG